MNYQIDNMPRRISGIYKLTFPNNKIYIGLSNDIKRRMWEHKTDNTNQPVSYAISKYGMPETVTVLVAGVENRDSLKAYEKHYIKLYKSNNRAVGYNVTEGGDGTSSGTKNVASVFTDEDILEIQNLLVDLNLSVKEIAEKFNCHPETISRINTGKHYYNACLVYPLRNQYEKRDTGSKVHNASFSDNEFYEVVHFLQNKPEMSLAAIARHFEVHPRTIHNLNQGKTYYDKEREYPIRGRSKNA